MRFAIPIHNQRVSPVMDAARLLHVFELTDQVVCQEVVVLDLFNQTTEERVETIVAHDIQTLICGALSREMDQLLRQRGIKLIPWVAGIASSVIEAYRKNDIYNDTFSMPGCGCQVRMRRRQGGCRRNQNRNGGKNR